ncbi:MAG: hypothetical protein JNJ46_11330 [Myxococcales bacterium]|nr:hypothetical protein [Myxococcales bacterium]
MDQDFHYYGTFYAARIAGFNAANATLIAKCSNFIDFLSNQGYGGYWRLVRDKRKLASRDQYTVVGDVTSPRYTFQGTLSTGVAAEDGMWCSYHFTPGNFADPEGVPTPAAVHGERVAALLPAPTDDSIGRYHEVRRTPGISKPEHATLLNRPMSGLSRALLADTIEGANNPARLRRILMRAVGASELLGENATVEQNTLRRFRLCLLGVRAHVIADTWAHQDFSGIGHDMNTYWDVNGWSVGRQGIQYDVGNGWVDVVLSSSSHENLQAAPNVAKIGHGWMGHFPDYSFVKFRYRPGWGRKSDTLERDNPTQYRYAFLELCSLFARARSRDNHFEPGGATSWLTKAGQAISSACDVADKSVCPRVHSSNAWLEQMAGLGTPMDLINTKLEPDPKAVLDGLLEGTDGYTRYGTYIVQATSDLYLFQIAADYHFHFVRNFLKRHDIMTFGGSWSQQIGPLSQTVTDLF